MPPNLMVEMTGDERRLWASLQKVTKGTKQTEDGFRKVGRAGKKAGKDTEGPKKKKATRKKSSKERRKIKSLQRRFSYLEDQFKKVKSMSTGKAISLTKKLMNFRDVALKERLAGDFEKEILQVYSMIDAIEEELNSRN